MFVFMQANRHESVYVYACTYSNMDENVCMCVYMYKNICIYKLCYPDAIMLHYITLTYLNYVNVIVILHLHNYTASVIGSC